MIRVFELARPVRGMPVWLRYVAATAIILVFFLLRQAAGPVMTSYPFLLFFPAIVLVSILFDRGSGLYAVGLSLALSWYFFVPVRQPFRLEQPQAALPLALYTLVALFIALTVEALRASAERLQATKTALEEAVELNRLLLLDVNHRVKNHLASAGGLLRLSLREAALADPQAVIEGAARRIEVLGQVYDRLHLGGQATVVSARAFITGLCEDLSASVVGARPIRLEVEVDDVPLESSQAVPIGLVINELVENALKYAFAEGRAGRIAVNFVCENGHCVLTVADDGVGYDPSKIRKGGGTRLLDALARQLGAKVDSDARNGVKVRLSFGLATEISSA